jgi:hypothetical protein
MILSPLINKKRKGNGWFLFIFSNSSSGGGANAADSTTAEARNSGLGALPATARQSNHKVGKKKKGRNMFY